MGRDRMLPDKFAEVNPRTLTPVFNTIVVGVVVAIIAGFVPSDYLWDTVSIGTLMAFSMVAIGVIVLRRTQPDLERPFKVPGYPVTPVLTVAACVYVLSGLAAITWVIFGVWLAIVMAFYFLWGRHHSRLNDVGPGRARTPEMTLVVGFSPGKDDWSSIELGATLARSVGHGPAGRHRRAQRLAHAGRRPHRPGVRGLGASNRAPLAVAEANAILAEHCPDVAAVARVDARPLGRQHAAGAGRGGRRQRWSSSGRAAPAATAASTRAPSATGCCTPPTSPSPSRPTATPPASTDASVACRVPSAGTRGRFGPWSARPPSARTSVRRCGWSPSPCAAAPSTPRGSAPAPRTWCWTAGSARRRPHRTTPSRRWRSPATRRPRSTSVVASGRSWGAAIDRLDWDRDEVLVVGSSSAGVIERIFLGSNASKIVRHSPVPGGRRPLI